MPERGLEKMHAPGTDPQITCGTIIITIHIRRLEVSIAFMLTRAGEQCFWWTSSNSKTVRMKAFCWTRLTAEIPAFFSFTTDLGKSSSDITAADQSISTLAHNSTDWKHRRFHKEQNKCLFSESGWVKWAFP